MPKVSIREIDNTGSETLEYLNYTVLIPGPKLTYIDDKEQTHVLGLGEGDKVEIYTKASDITGLSFVDAPAGYKTELGYLMATQLLSQGLSVCFFPAYTIEEDPNKEGALIKRLIVPTGKTASEALEEMFKEFADKGKYDLRFITLGGIDETLSTSIFEKATIEAWRCAGDRGDAVAILNTPKSLSGTPNFYSVYKHKHSDPDEYSKDPAEGFELKYLSPAQYDALSDENKAKCKAWTSFVTYIKEKEESGETVKYYSKEATEGYTKTSLTYEDYLAVLASDPENEAKCTPEKSSIGELTSSTDVDTWVNANFESFADTKIERTGVTWSGSEQATETYGRYGAMFTPHVTTKLWVDGKTTSVIIPASFDYLACFAKHIGRYKSWFAMSGAVRGVSPYSNITPTIVFGDADINNVLQIRTSDSQGHLATNAICEIRPYGNIVWGNRTLHPLKRPDNADSNSAIQLTASSFLNIRQLCCDIKKTLYRAARRFTFEPNSDALWYNFKSVITPLLDEMKSNQGIKGYQIVKIKTSKKAVLVAKIKIVPIEAVEDFDLTVELSDSIDVTE